MSCIYFKPFTFKKVISFVFLGLSCFIFDNNAYAEAIPKIIGHFYVTKDSSNMKYDDRIQWEMTNYFEWSELMDNLKKLPKDTPKDNPMGLKQSEVIHFNVANPDQKSGHDIFISKAGIQQFSKMPFDVYYAPSPPFREFLETEMSTKPGYDSTEDDVNINAPGIVVIYRGSVQLKNPSWVIKLSDDRALQNYKTYIASLQPNISKSGTTIPARSSDFESEGTFIMYLNYPNAPQKILVIGTNNGIRGTKIVQQSFYYKDSIGYFSMFKRQAEDNLRATQREEEPPEEKRKREAVKGDLF